jgi:hypothetical protein
MKCHQPFVVQIPQTNPVRVRVRVRVRVLWDVETSLPRREAAPRFLLGQGVDGTWNGEEGTKNREPRGQ